MDLTCFELCGPSTGFPITYALYVHGNCCPVPVMCVPDCVACWVGVFLGSVFCFQSRVGIVSKIWLLVNVWLSFKCWFSVQKFYIYSLGSQNL